MKNTTWDFGFVKNFGGRETVQDSVALSGGLNQTSLPFWLYEVVMFFSSLGGLEEFLYSVGCYISKEIPNSVLKNYI